MNKPRPQALGTVLAVGTLIAGRWLALLATAYFSLFHWMRSEYLEFSHIWQYGLPLLDPRVGAALLWWVLYSLFLILVVLPAAHWLAARLPTAGSVRWAAWVALALGLGTRGIVGPIVMRAAVAHPVALLPGGGETLSGVLVETHLARGVVALTEAWWLVPALVVIIRAADGTAVMPVLRSWRAALFLVLYALVQSPEVAYLLTGGGPRGATMSLPLLAYQLGFGAQEFGYASVLTVLMSGAVLLGGFLGSARVKDAISEPGPTRFPARGYALWWATPVLVAVPLVIAWNRNPPELATEPRIMMWCATSLVTSIAAAGWTCLLLRPLAQFAESSGERRFRRMWLLGPVLLPSLVWILPAVRVFGHQHGWMDSLIPCAGLIFGAPYLYLGLGVVGVLRARGEFSARGVVGAGAVIAWVTWTDALNPLMLTQTMGGAHLLPTGVVWKLSTHLWSSPLSVPGWGQAWLGAGCLAMAAIVLLLNTPDELAHSP